MPNRWLMTWWVRFKRIVKRIARSTGTPHQIAFGAAIGVFVGMSPTIGLQMIIAATLATLLKANRVAAILPVWLSNPVTLVPLYSFNYWIGMLAIRGPGLQIFRTELSRIAAVWETVGAWEAMKRLASMGGEMALTLWVGCLVVGFFAAVPAYYLTRWAVEKIRARRAHKMAARDARVTRFLRLDRLGLGRHHDADGTDSAGMPAANGDTDAPASLPQDRQTQEPATREALPENEMREIPANQV